MERLPWLERKFHFDVPPGWLQNICARLTGTEARLRHLRNDLSDENARLKPAGKWSIKEHIGHLHDLELLHLKRLEDFAGHHADLSVWDTTNSATEKANHNETTIDALINAFSLKREEFITRLKSLDDHTQHFKSLHPRLKIMMKPVDMATFIAEHDDHHLASIHEILDAQRIA